MKYAATEAVSVAAISPNLIYSIQVYLFDIPAVLSSYI